MRILIIAGRVSQGGIEQVLAVVVDELLRQGHVVGIAATEVDTFGRTALNPAAAIFELGPRFPSAYIVSLLATIRKFGADSILTTASDVSAAVLLLRMAAFPNVRVVVSQHQPISSLPRSRGMLRRVRHRSGLLLCKALYRHADMVIAVSQGVLVELVAHFGVDSRKCRVVGNPIITADFSRRSSEHVDWPWADRSIPTIIYVGRAAPEKRLDLLLAAFGSITLTSPLRLLLVGPTMDESQVPAALAASGQVRAIGFRNNPLPYIAAADVLVLCSDFEGFGNVLVEAMGCGTQVVATDCPFGPREILSDGRYGQLVPTGDPDALARAIQRALGPEDRVPREELVERAGDFEAGESASAYLHELT